MTAGAVTLPAQGVGTDTPDVAVDTVAGKSYQLVKLVDGTTDQVTPAPVAAPADGVVNTRAALWVGSELMLYDQGTSLWNRARGTIANGLLVDVSRMPAVTISGTVPVADGGGSLTVDGTVAVSTLPPTPAGTNNIGDVDVLTVPSDPFGANADAAATAGAAGTIQAKLRLMTTQLNALLTGIPISQWLGSAAPTVGQKTAAASIPVTIASDQSPVNFVVAPGTEIPMVPTVIDPVDGSGVSVPIKFVRVNATADGDNVVIAAVASKRLRVLGYALVATAAGTISIQNTAGSPIILAQFPLAAQGGVSYAGGYDAPAFETPSGTGLEINNPAGVDTLGHITYVEL
jgi:hypothetical protein